MSQKHNISFDAGNESMTVRVSAGTLSQTGIVPTSKYTKNNISLAGTAKLANWVNVESSLQFMETTNTKVSKGTGGPLQRAMTWPLTDDMRVYLDEKGSIRYPNRYVDVDILNPYFDLYKNKNYDEGSRFIANVAVNITPIKDLLLKAQVGYDVANTTYEVVRHPEWSSTATGTGSYDQSRVYQSNPTVNLIASYKKDFGKLSVTGTFIYSQLEQFTNTLSVHGEKFLVKDFQSINNCDKTTLVNLTSRQKRRLQGLSGSFEFGWNNMAFLTVRGRNDWSSTLPLENNSYFYPALDLSFIVSELPFMKAMSETFSYLKLRGSVTRVGKDAPPLSIYPALEASTASFGGYRYGFTGPNVNLKPEMNTAWEVGLEARLFRNRMDVDFAYYNTYSADQIITGFRMSYATGFVLNNMNVGTFRTEGVELRVAGDVIKNRDWVVNLGLNMSKNWSEVIKLPENVSEYYNAYTWNSGNLRNGIKVGYPVTSITGLDFQRNKDGKVLIDPSTGLPLVSSTWSVLGDREPDLMFGLTLSVRYKSFSLSALLDGKLGTQVVNGTKRWMMEQGFSDESVKMREAGPVVFNGVLKDGLQDSDNPTVNSIGVKLGDLQYGYAGGDYNWIEKGINYLRVQELRLNYNVNRKWLESVTKGIVSAASIYVMGSDLFVFTNYSGIDVVSNSNSSSLGGTGGVGFDMMAIAAPRGLSFGINLTF
ncbi:MAG: TonB-dependent receptor [Rikenellaceae bacterium]